MFNSIIEYFLQDLKIKILERDKKNLLKVVAQQVKG